MDYFPDYGFGLHRVIYVSRLRLPVGEQADFELDQIAATSSRRNRSRAITGALLFYDGWCVQALEGSRDVVKPLYERISADPRHSEVKLKAVQVADKRVFWRWGMKRVAPPAGQPFDIGSATADELLALLRLSAMAPFAKAA